MQRDALQYNLGFRCVQSLKFFFQSLNHISLVSDRLFQIIVLLTFVHFFDRDWGRAATNVLMREFPLGTAAVLILVRLGGRGGEGCLGVMRLLQ